MSHYHLYAIGNALVDSEYEVTDEHLGAMGVDKRHMTLIDGNRRAELLRHVTGHMPRRTGGGSAGNTVTAVAQLGGKAFYSCRVADDELGQFYADDLAHNGVATNLSHTRAQHGQTGCCMVFVTPDAERSMCTFLGATAELEENALHPKDIARSRVYYMEGYLAASPTGLAAALKGRQLAVEAGVSLAATLSDVSMINFCRPGLEAILAGGLDYLFCNEEEAQVWCGSQDMAEIVQAMGALARTVCITRGPKGCLLIEQGATTEVPTTPVQAVDTNGAGDMFAGAFLFGVTHGYTLEQAASLGNRCAAAVVSQHGNRLTPDQMLAIKQEFERATRQPAVA
jgi:sugar/nucleoside kinase (ribokinase family)